MTEVSKRGRGRPRDDQLDEKIFAATTELLAAHGLAGTSIDAVARLAGVSKASIYRRFRDKNDLVTAVIAAWPRVVASETTGTTRERIVRIMQEARERMVDGPGMRIHVQMLAELDHNPELVELHRSRTVAVKRTEFQGVLRDGIAAGEVRADLDLDLCTDVVAGAWMARWAAGREFEQDWAEQTVALIWPSIAA